MHSNTINQFCSQLIPYQYVSFDIFDTLIFRTVSDFRVVHQMVAVLYELRYGRAVPLFPKQRMAAEITARNLLGGGEVTLDMIYEQLYQYSKEEAFVLRTIEEQCEIDNCVPNQPMIAVWKWCRRQGKKIVITTDMYLSRNVIQSILVKIGVDYDFLFISGEENVTKRTGKLFSNVLKKLKIDSPQIVHIGDDSNNDIAMPKVYGIVSLERIMNEKKSMEYIIPKLYSNTVAGDHLRSILVEYASNFPSMTSEQRIGYTLLGPLLVDFCQWLHQMKEKKHLNKLFFVAREGYLIQKVYATLYPEETDSLVYVRLNKNLLRLPLLSNSNACEYFVKAKLGRLTYAWNVIFDHLYIEDYEAAKKQIRDKVGFTDFDTSITLQDLESGRYNYILTVLFDWQKLKIEEQASLLEDYLLSMGFFNGAVGLVNNSINGNGQALLTSYLSMKGRKADIWGLQFMKTYKCEKLLEGKCSAWLTDSNIEQYAKMKFHVTCLMFEHLLFEPNGTSLLFLKEDGQIKVKCETPRTEQLDFQPIASIQKFAIQFAHDYVRHIPLPLNMMGFYGYFNMLINPNFEDAKLLCHLHDDDVDGDKLISDPIIPFKRKYLLSCGIPFELTWLEGYFVLKKVPYYDFLLYKSHQRYLNFKVNVKRVVKTIICK